MFICNCGTETPLLILRPSLPETPKLDRGDYKLEGQLSKTEFTMAMVRGLNAK